MSVTQYALLYSLYSWPNVILSVFGGYLLDRVFGVRLGTVIFSAFVCLGQVGDTTFPLFSYTSLSWQLVFSMGAYIDKYWLMLVGRFVFGSVVIDDICHHLALPPAVWEVKTWPWLRIIMLCCGSRARS